MEVEWGGVVVVCVFEKGGGASRMRKLRQSAQSSFDAREKGLLWLPMWPPKA